MREPVPLRPATARRLSLFWFAVWLAALLDVTKIAYLSVGGTTPRGDWRQYAVDLTVVTHADHLFVLAMFLIGEVLLVLTRRAARLHRWAWRVGVSAGVVCVLYTIVALRAYAALLTMLTYPLIYLAANLTSMRSSLEAYLTPALLLALVAAPVLYVLAARAADRWLDVTRMRAFPALVVVGAVLIVGQAGVASREYASAWRERSEHRLAQNPHWALLASVATELSGRGSVRLPHEFPTAFASDFATIGERPPGAPLAVGPAGRPRHLIVVVLESTAARYLSVYGSRSRTTPRLEAEAARAMIFDNVYAHCALSTASLIAILGSRYPAISWREEVRERPRLPITTLANLLEARGYRTAFITSGDLGYSNTDRFLRGRGFGTLRDYRDLGPKLSSWGTDDRHLVDAVVNFIEAEQAHPFFVFAWTTQTHHPYVLAPGQTTGPGEERAAGSDLSRYLAIIRHTDEQLGRLFDALRRRGLADDTLVVLTGDHGESFGSPHQAYIHGDNVFQEEVNVPLILWSPRLFPSARRSAIVGSHVDLAPTIADLLGVPPAPSWQGRSLFDPTHPERAYFYAVARDYVLGVREGGHKYVYNATAGTQALYALRHDPDEQVNLAASAPERTARLRGRVAAWVAAHPSGGSSSR